MYEYLDPQIRDSTYVGQTNVKSLSEDSSGLSKFRDASGAHSHGVEQKDNPGKSSMNRAQKWRHLAPTISLENQTRRPH